MEAKRFFATCTDMGAATVMHPILKNLQTQGHEVIVFVSPDAPARDVLTRLGMPPKVPADLGITGWSMTEMLAIIGGCFQSHVVIAGLGVGDKPEKSALLTAYSMGIPTAVPFETWPHRCMAVHKEYVEYVYGKANRIFVPDEISREFMMNQGFGADQVMALGNPANEYLEEVLGQREKVRTLFRELHGIPESAILIAFLTTLDLDDPYTDDPKNPEWYGTGETEVVKEFLSSLHEVHGSPIMVRGVIRQKPSYGQKRIRQLIAELNPEVAFDESRDMRGLQILLASDLAVGMGTIMIQSAALSGIPGIYYTPRRCVPEDMITNEIGLTIPMNEEGGLRRLIHRLADEPGSLIELRDRTKLAPLKKNASKNIADELVRLASSTR